jgi:hypothetical protein
MKQLIEFLNKLVITYKVSEADIKKLGELLGSLTGGNQGQGQDQRMPPQDDSEFDYSDSDSGSNKPAEPAEEE